MSSASDPLFPRLYSKLRLIRRAEEEIARIYPFDQIRSPVQFHFGGSDPYIPRDRVRAVQEAAARYPNVELHVEEDAGHAFHNRKAPMFYQAEPAARAWQQAEEFLHRHLPVRSGVS